MAETARAYRDGVHYLQHKTSVQQALTKAGRVLKDAYQEITGNDPGIALLEEARALLEVALREARAMANLDDSAIARREPAA